MTGTTLDGSKNPSIIWHLPRHLVSEMRSRTTIWSPVMNMSSLPVVARLLSIAVYRLLSLDSDGIRRCARAFSDPADSSNDVSSWLIAW